MRWKRKSNIIIAYILTIIYTIVTLLNLIGPLHMNGVGTINKEGALAEYSILYWVVSLLITWGIYFSLRKKPEALFFILIVLGIALIIAENFLWAIIGP
jgi:hypothetical protein